MTKKQIALLLTSALFSTASAYASPAPIRQVADLDQGAGTVEFHAIGRPSAIKIVGKGTAPQGHFLVAGNEVTGEARFPLDSLDTGISMRNHHMKEKYLETGKYPEAKLTITKMVLPSDKAENVPFTGKLLLHGVENPVTGVANVERTGTKINVAAQFSLKVGDYKISSPSFAGITMADEVQVAVNTSAPLAQATAKK